MDLFWLPGYQPPQVSADARVKVYDIVKSNGIISDWDSLTFLFRDAHPPLRDYMAEFEFHDMDGEVIEDPRPRSAFRIGGVLTSLAYHESGFDDRVDDDAFGIAHLDAEFEGIPEAYLTQYIDDPQLQLLMELTAVSLDFQFGGGYENHSQMLALGAGCVRHYLKHAIEQ